MTSTFWGLRLEPGKRYSTTVDKAFHVTMAALDCNTVKNEKDIHCVMLEEGESNMPFILCNLQKPKVLQSRLDLNFESGDRITFFCRGTGTIHLTGYIMPEEEYPSIAEEGDDEEVEEEEEEDEDEEEDEEEEEDVSSDKGSKVNGVPGKRKGEGVAAALPAKKKKKQVVEQQESGDESDEEDEVEDEEEDMEADDESADSDVEDESDEESESEIPVEDKKPSPSLEKQGKKKNKQQQQQQPQQGKQKQNAQVNGAQQGPQQKKKPQQQQPAGEKTGPGKRTLEGGVTVQDLKVGNGPICKPGKVVTVYYTGRLKSNNKVFDQTSQGPGLKFRIGRGEVIKGWDVGLAGMKVGGKRLINIPSNMAYGQKGMAPTIPPNSALVFEVELKGVS